MPEYADREQLHTSEKDDGGHDRAPSGFGVTEAADLAQEGPKGQQQPHDDGQESEASRSGFLEKYNKALEAKRSILLKGYFVSPATRALRS